MSDNVINAINEKKIKVRIFTLNDYDQIIALQKKCFLEMLLWNKEQFKSIVNTFKEG